MNQNRFRGSHSSQRRLLPAALLVAAALASPMVAQPIDLSRVAAGTGGFVLNGAAAGDQAAFAVSAAGDVNGDGRGDFLVGAPSADASAGADAGRTYVVFGRTATVPIDLSTLQSGSSSLGFVINGQAADDYSAASAASAGDVNGDGLADIIVGAPYADVGALLGAGKAYVVFGKSTTAPVELSDIDAASPTGGFVVRGFEAYSYAGRSVACAGDVNGDGLADVIVGVWRSGAGASGGIGRSFVILGRTGTTPVSLGTMTGGGSTNGFVITGQSFRDYSGLSVSSAGDVNGDGLSDLVVGAPNVNVASADDVGRAYVVFGKKSTSAVALNSVAAGTGGFAMTGVAASDFTGYSVAGAGDVNGDGLADVIVGAWFSDPSAGLSAGRSYVVFGKSTTTALELSTLLGGSSSAGFVVNGEAAGDLSGATVAGAGDLNGDGLADLLIGAPFHDTSAGIYAGRSYVIFGATAPLGSVDLTQLAGGTSTLGFVINGQSAGDRSGYSVSGAGDVNGDGLEDLLVGAYYSSPGGVTRAGRAYVVFSAATPPPSATYKTTIAAGNAPRWAVGTTNHGVDATTFPSSRLWIDVGGGTTASVVTAALTRNKAGVSGIATAGNVRWEASTVRANFLPVRVALRYTDAEIAGLNEANLYIYTATSLAGPWVALSATTRQPERNEISATTTLLTGPTPWSFIISDTPPPTPSPTPTPIPTPTPPGAANNDNFADAKVLVGLDIADNTTATREPGELFLYQAGESGSLWWKWTPAVRSLGTIDTCGSAIDTVLGVYTGPALGSLFLVAKNDNTTIKCPGTRSLVSFVGEPGTTYFITVAGYTLSQTNPPATPVAVPATGLINITLTEIPMAANGDANGDGSIDVADLTAIHNQLAGFVPPPLAGDGDVDNDGDVDLNDANLLTDHLVNKTPLP